MIFKMKKIGIVTPYGNNNFGNKLQNYALQETLKKMGCEVTTFVNYNWSNSKSYYFVRMIKNKFFSHKVVDDDRTLKFYEFNKNIKYSQRVYNAFDKYSEFDYVIAGSDQIWNPNQGKLRDFDLLSNVEAQKRISYAASFGIDKINTSYYKKLKKQLSKFKAISVRENQGATIIKNIINEKKVDVHIDPTLLLSEKEWEKVIVKPSIEVPKKYILCYFLGQVDEEYNKAISDFAIKNKCEVIYLLDKNDKYYTSGPGEFLYLEKNAFLICTDSFHSSVFAFLFNKPFIIFDRKQKELKKMNSRMNTFVNTFKLNNVFFIKKIENSILNYDYKEGYRVLELEREKSIKYLNDNINNS